MAYETLDYSNFYESKISTNSLGSSDTSLIVSSAPTYDGTNAISVPFYLVLNPDSLTKREVVKVTAMSGTTLTITRDVESRYVTNPSHDVDDIIRMGVIDKIFENLQDGIEDRIKADSTDTLTNKTFDANATGNNLSNVEVADLASSAVVTESEGINNNDNDTSLATSAAIVDYVSSNASVKNEFINGSFNIWQRGTSFTGTKYTADRWRVTNGGTGTITTSRQTHDVDETGVDGQPKYYIELAKSASNRFTNSDFIEQRIEDVKKFSNSTKWTVSFYAKASESNMTITPKLVYDFGSSGSADVTETKSAITLTTSWARYDFTFTGTSLTGKTISSGSTFYNNDYLAVQFLLSSSSGSANTYSISNVQINSGEQAGAFVIENAGEQLKLCQRYYQLLVDGSAGTRVPVGIGFYSSSQIIDGMAQTKNDFRGPVTISTTSGGNHYQATSGGVITDNFDDLSVNLTDTNNFNNRGFGIFHNGDNSNDLASQSVGRAITITANSSSTKITAEAEL